MDTLVFLATATGGGVAASLAFEFLRMAVPLPATPPRGGWAAVLIWLLWAPLGARLTAMSLATICIVTATVCQTLIQGQPVLPALLAAIDLSLGAAGVSQLVHAVKLSRAVPPRVTP